MTRSREWHRSLDYWLGVPLVRLAATVRRRRRLPEAPRRIGLMSPTAMGDLILGSGLIFHLRATYPQADIHLFHGANNAGVVPLLPGLLHAYQCDFTDVLSTASLIRKADLDVLVDLTPWSRLTALYAAASKSVTVGFDAERQLRHYAFDIAVPHSRSRHELQNLQRMAEVFAACPDYRPHLTHDLPTPTLELPYQKLILCHVAAGGSRASEKSWPDENWAQLAKRLAARGFMVAFTGTKHDAPRIAGILAMARLPQDCAVSICGALTVVELSATLRAARLLITVDTGVLHLASALEIPTVALHGPTRSERWGSKSPRTVSLDAPHPEAGFIHFGFEQALHGGEIMSTLTVEQVYTAALGVLGLEVP